MTSSAFEEIIYDAYGRVTSKMTRAGDSIDFDYDDLGRMIEKAPDNMLTVSYEYDLAGRLKKVITAVVSGNPASGEFEYFYDTAGRLIKEEYPDGKQVQYQLDEGGNVTRLTYPDSYYVERVYDELGRMTDVKLNGATSSALEFDYDQLSRRTKLTYENGVETDYALEWDNDLNSLVQTFNGSSVEFTYGFNSVHELTSQAVDDATFMWHPASGGTVSYGTANSMNQYPSVGGNSYTYDDNGCLTDDGVWDFGYDTMNRLVSADDGTTSASYLYDPTGRQTQKEVNSTKTRYIHAGIRIIAEYNGSDTFVKRYVHGPGLDQVLLEIDNSNNVTYLHHDRLGSIIATTDDTGAVIDTFAYSPWGESGSMSGTTFGFTGQRYDAETGLYFYKNRHYSPEIGRFLQPDPIGYGDGLNMYSYAYNNPNTFTDPLGTAADGSRLGSDIGSPLLRPTTTVTSPPNLVVKPPTPIAPPTGVSPPEVPTTPPAPIEPPPGPGPWVPVYKTLTHREILMGSRMFGAIVTVVIVEWILLSELQKHTHIFGHKGTWDDPIPVDPNDLDFIRNLHPEDQTVYEVNGKKYTGHALKRAFERFGPNFDSRVDEIMQPWNEVGPNKDFPDGLHYENDGQNVFTDGNDTIRTVTESY